MQILLELLVGPEAGGSGGKSKVALQLPPSCRPAGGLHNCPLHSTLHYTLHYTALHTALHTVLHTVLHCTTYCTSYCTTHYTMILHCTASTYLCTGQGPHTHRPRQHAFINITCTRQGRINKKHKKG